MKSELTPEQKAFDSAQPANPERVNFQLPENFIMRIIFGDNEEVMIKHNVRGCGKIFIYGSHGNPKTIEQDLQTHQGTCEFIKK